MKFVTNLNYELLSREATKAIMALDDSFVGTENYMGIAYFWDGEYKFILREVEFKTRQKVHQALLKAGLDVGGFSEKHTEIINKLTKNDRKLKRVYIK